MKNLDLTQKPAQGCFLIEASAGTGKTYSISNLFLHFILQGNKISEILVVTFTNAATKELRERLRENLLKAIEVQENPEIDETIANILKLYPSQEELAHLKNAAMNIDQTAIMSIHGFCQRMLLENAFESQSLFDAELITNIDEVITLVCQDYWRKKNYAGQKTKLSIDDFKRLVKTYNGEKICGSESIDFSQLETIKNKTIQAWKDHKDEALPFAQEHKMSKSAKHPYKDEHIQQYIATMDQFVIGEESDELAETLNLLSQRRIDEAAIAVKKGIAPQHCLFETIGELSPYYSNTAEKIEFLQNFFDDFEKVKQEKNILSFDDLIQRFARLLTIENGNGPLHQRIRDKFKVALVDEFQDTDPQQYKIFHSLFNNEVHAPDHSLYMIGDPKQSIYAFRNADIFAYLKAKKQAKESFTLKTNFRSEKGMVDAVNAFFQSKEPQDEVFAFPKTATSPGISFIPVEAGAAQLKKPELYLDNESQSQLQLCWFEGDENGEALPKSKVGDAFEKSVLAECLKLLNLSANGKATFKAKDGEARPLRASDIAILCSKNKEAQMYKSLLNANGIAAIVQNSGNVFHAPEAKAIQVFLETLIEPREKQITKLLLSPFFNMRASQIKDYDEQKRHELLCQFKAYQAQWMEKGFMDLFLDFIEKNKINEKVLLHSDGDRRMTDLIHLSEILHQASLKQNFGLSALATFLKEKISSDKEDDEYEQRLESDANAVQIMTVHKSKGLEFPVVFCPSIWQRNFIEDSHPGFNSKNLDFKFYDEAGNRSLHIDPKADDRAESRHLWRRESLGEQVRLLYVALTRAANRCYLYWGNIKGNKSALSYLADPQSTSATIQNGTECSSDSSLYEKYWQKLASSHLNINLQTFSKDSEIAKLQVHTEELKLANARSTKRVSSQYRVGSYSGLIRNHEKLEKFIPDSASANKDDDDKGESTHEATDPIEAKGVFAFPRGAKPGLAIHEIFEHIDFCDNRDWREQTINSLSSSMLIKELKDKERQSKKDQANIEACLDILQNTIDAKLPHENFSLSDVKVHERLNEMDFYFPVESIQLRQLTQIFAQHYPIGSKNHDFAQDLHKLNYAMQKGFINGSIDLSFEHEQKFYVLDWKSNHLGNQASDYNQENMRQEVRNHFYFLQYHIYSLALHLYLKNNLEGYNYKTHFGGCYYVFVRGCDPQAKAGEETGFFYDKLPYELIQDLESLFLGARS